MFANIKNCPLEDCKTVLPPEVWISIFRRASSSVSSLMELRLVCPAWRDVIDDYVCFQPIINDKDLDISCLSHLRVNQCTVTNLITPLHPNNFLFRKPELVRKLWLEGLITRENFMIFVAQCTNLEQLDLKMIHMIVKDFLVSKPPEVATKIDRFLGRLTHLKVGGIGEGKQLFDDLPAYRNFTRIMYTHMPNLNTLHLDFDKFNLEDSHLFSFLVDCAPNLEHVKINCCRAYNQPIHKHETFPVKQQFTPVHLRTLLLLIPDAYWETNWLPIVLIQRSLENLRIAFTSQPGFSNRIEDCPKFTDVEDTVVLNKATLEELTLINVVLTMPLNAGLFQGMNKLQKLEIFNRRNSLGEIFNLDMLPPSIKFISLPFVTCFVQEIRQILENFEELEVVFINRRYYKPPIANA